MPVMDMFWDRIGHLMDPCGHTQSIATHKQDLSKEVIQRAGEASFKI
jgi:PhnB protein